MASGTLFGIRAKLPQSHFLISNQVHTLSWHALVAVCTFGPSLSISRLDPQSQSIQSVGVLIGSPSFIAGKLSLAFSVDCHVEPIGVHQLPLITLDLPSPISLRGGWASMAAVCASRGWNDSACATPHEWLYHDGGGNWACLRFQSEGRAVLLGHDHEYTDTYFGAAAKYFGEEETNLLADAPAWWANDLSLPPFGEWIGFIYGWDGQQWQRARYEKSDGFEKVGLLSSCSVHNLDELV